MICSVEGGAQCETKQVKLDSGKAKCKLRAAENKPVRKEKKSQSHPTTSNSDAATSGAAGPKWSPGGVGARVPLHRRANQRGRGRR